MKYPIIKNITISTILHTLVLVWVIYTHPGSKAQSKQKTETPSQVELADSEPPKQPKSKKIIPINPIASEAAKPVEKKSGYYGIGVYIDPYFAIAICDGKQYVGLNITGVVDGYPAEALGLKHQDVIIEVEGHPLDGVVDVVGKAATVVSFTICRDGHRLYFSTIRAFIYNE